MPGGEDGDTGPKSTAKEPSSLMTSTKPLNMTRANLDDAPIVPVEEAHSPSGAHGSKRPAEEMEIQNEGTSITSGGLGTKRAKLDANISRSGAERYSNASNQRGPKLHGLIAPIWTKVFGYVPPVFLGRLLRVCRDFHVLLNPMLQDVATQSTVDPQEIWLASRQRFAPGLPKALPGQTELQMWRLIRGKSCQVCGKSGPLLTTSNHSDVWHADTTNEGLRVVWPLGIRCCVECFREEIEQEKTLLFTTSFPSFILPVCSCVFVAQASHYVPSVFVRDRTPPADVQISKAYSRSKVAELLHRSKAIKQDDPGAADQWLADLEQDSKVVAEAVMTWERWETKGGLGKVNYRKKDPSAVKQLPTTLRPPRLGNSAELRNGTATNESPLMSADTTKSIISPFSPYPMISPYSQLPSDSPDTPQSRTFQQLGPRPLRDLRDINEAKAARKAEIERRCIMLEPSLTPSVLAQMDSFQAALQIPAQLTDQAWELLKPRLLSQMEEAEMREKERVDQETALKAIAEERRSHETTSKEAKDALEQAWDISQAPLRDRLSLYADELIRSQWNNGQSLQKENCAKFAADILMYVRRRFNEDQQAGGFQSTNSAVAASNGSEDQTLILENMKWVFDNKIKPLTDPISKEIFLCQGCEDNLRYYGFEAVVQHYAAKHTKCLSHGTIVVHWRAKWPDPPPFHPDPDTATSIFRAVSQADEYQTTATTQLQPGSEVPFPPSNNSLNSSFVTSAVESHPQSLPGQALYNPSYGQQFPPYNTNVNSYSVYGPYQTFPQGVEIGPSIPLNAAAATQYYQSQGPSMPPQQNEQAYPPTLTGPQTPQAQMSEMAKHAREIWFAINGIKDIPASVRIFVVIHHVVARYAKTYHSDPGVSMFLDGLNQNAQMRPVRSLNNLACKACLRAVTFSGAETYQIAGLDASKLYTLPHLLNHFKNIHVESAPPTTLGGSGLATGPLDWKKDMLELPEVSAIFHLVHAHGMDDHKLSLIAQALPEVFRSPLPKLSVLRSNASSANNLASSNQLSYRNNHASQPDRSVERRQEQGECTPIASTLYTPDAMHRSLSSAHEYEAVGEDEYDPHRPAYLGIIVEPKQGTHSIRRATGRVSATSPEQRRFDLNANYHGEPQRQERDWNNKDHSSRVDIEIAKENHLTPKTEADRFLNELQPSVQQASLYTNEGERSRSAYKPTSPSRSVNDYRDHAARHSTLASPHTATPSSATFQASSSRGLVREYYADHSARTTETRLFRSVDGREWYETVEVRERPRSPVPREYAPIRYIDSNGYEVSRLGDSVYKVASPLPYDERIEQHPRYAQGHDIGTTTGRNGRIEYIPIPESHPNERRYVYTSTAPLNASRLDREPLGDGYNTGRSEMYR